MLGRYWGDAGTVLGRCWDGAGEMGEWGGAGAVLGRCWGGAGTMLGRCWGGAGETLGRCWAVPGRCRGDAGAMPGRCWGGVGAVLGAVLGGAGAVPGRCRGDAGAVLGRCWGGAGGGARAVLGDAGAVLGDVGAVLGGAGAVPGRCWGGAGTGLRLRPALAQPWSGPGGCGSAGGWWDWRWGRHWGSAGAQLGLARPGRGPASPRPGLRRAGPGLFAQPVRVPPSSPPSAGPARTRWGPRAALAAQAAPSGSCSGPAARSASLCVFRVPGTVLGLAAAPLSQPLAGQSRGSCRPHAHVPGAPGRSGLAIDPYRGEHEPAPSVPSGSDPGQSSPLHCPPPPTAPDRPLGLSSVCFLISRDSLGLCERTAVCCAV
ncbi:uncharacterized PE-PGRS family protein PE_PGRS10-like [Pithys albifrons albifrons]|uniref:uncharacterized PE-PGRS family protein PE_PGRS10-like n=1 Tax=Pithys albifrons albifrons TaxID=3385563 RepID=UPI003A5CB633